MLVILFLDNIDVYLAFIDAVSGTPRMWIVLVYSVGFDEFRSSALWAIRTYHRATHLQRVRTYHESLVLKARMAGILTGTNDVLLEGLAK